MQNKSCIITKNCENDTLIKFNVFELQNSKTKEFKSVQFQKDENKVDI
jgi:hypothetical protein